MLNGLIACGAAILLLASLLGWQTWQLGVKQEELGGANTALQVCKDKTADNAKTALMLETDLAGCIGETNVVESELLADASIRAAELEQLERRVASLQTQLRRALESDECAGDPVPGDAVERVRDAADRAHRAGHEDGPPVGPDSG